MSNKNPDNKDEKYYSPDMLIDELFILLRKYYTDEITEYMENSAGDGRIIDRFDRPYIAYDIEPHRDDIVKCNYLKEKIPYKKGRVAVLNPPFSNGLRFIKKTLTECDYVVSILSINSFLNIDYSKYWVDEIQIWRKVKFDNIVVSVCLVAMRNKTINDKYEYE